VTQEQQLAHGDPFCLRRPPCRGGKRAHSRFTRAGFTRARFTRAGFTRAGEKKVFFFEKKNQKTFALALSQLRASVPDRALNQTRKSFFVLLFKKEHPFLLL
jgi:hypothetical protein